MLNKLSAIPLIVEPWQRHHRRHYDLLEQMQTFVKMGFQATELCVVIYRDLTKEVQVRQSYVRD